jgi:hypothetical protein
MSKNEPTVLHLHLCKTDGSDNVLGLAFCGGRIVFRSLDRGPFRMGHAASSNIPLSENSKRVRELYGALRKFQSLSKLDLTNSEGTEITHPVVTAFAQK